MSEEDGSSTDPSTDEGDGSSMGPSMAGGDGPAGSRTKSGQTGRRTNSSRSSKARNAKGGRENENVSNSNDRQKKPTSKSRSYVGKSRCQPANLQILFKQLVDQQIRAIKKLSVGNTLKCQILKEKLLCHLILYLIRRVNTDNNTLELGPKDDLVAVDLFKAARKVFGLVGKGRDELVDKLVAKFGGGRRAPKTNRKIKKPLLVKHAKVFATKLLKSRKKRKTTCKIYMYAILAFILASNSGIGVDLRFWDLVEDVDNIKNFNLSDFVVKLLVKGIKDINDKTSKYLVGSPFLLIVIFLDMIIDDELDMPQDDDPANFPRIQHIKDKHLKWINGKMKDDWDKLSIRKLSESVYRDELVYDLERTYDWGTDCDDEWEEEKVDDLSHIQCIEGEDMEDDSSDSYTEVDKHSLSRQKEDAGAVLSQRLKETFVYLHDNRDAILKDVESIIKEHAPDLPSDTSTSICNALTSYALSRNTEFENKLNAIGKPLFEYCKLGKKLLLDREEQPHKKKLKRHSKAKIDHPYPAVYKYPADKNYAGERIILSCEDLHSLSGSDYVSDIIIDLYFKHVTVVYPGFNLNSGIDKQYFICNTFFWEKIEKEPIVLKSWLVKQLKNTVDDIKYFFLPVNENHEHWCLAIIYRPQGGASTTTSIFCLDSLVNERRKDWVLERAERFARNVLDIKHDEIHKIALPVPQQGQTLDCGFFTLYNVERVITDVSDTFSLEQITSDWYEPRRASELRQKTMNLIASNKVIYERPVGNCKICPKFKGHESLVKDFKHTFSS